MTAARKSRNLHSLERLSRVMALTALALALMGGIAAPLLALSWSHQPFPGFLVEQTLVVNGIKGDGWGRQPADPDYPQRVTRLGGTAVAKPADFTAVIREQAAGQQVSILTELPDGSARLFPSVTLTDFPPADMVRLFWLPYLVGLVYLGIGIWIYRARGNTAPGRSLAYLCANIAIVCILFFDLSTTHVAPAVWTAALAQIGGALIGLALRFPEPTDEVQLRSTTGHRASHLYTLFAGQRAWLPAVPYVISAALTGWGILVVRSTSRPWAYVGAWGASYRFIAFGILVFLGVMLFRARAGGSPLVRRQARVVFWGSVLAFTPVTLWFVAPLLSLSMPFDAVLFVPGLLVFPLAVAVAILRYRLTEADIIVNRTIAYSALMAILAGVFTASIIVSQKVFVALTGDKSDAAIVITTLIVGAAFAPIRKRLERFVDTQFGQVPDRARDLKQFGEQVRSFTQMCDAEQVAKRLLEEAVSGLQAQSGAISLVAKGQPKTVVTCGRWTGETWISVPLEDKGIRYGILFLGPHQDQTPYGRDEFETLQKVVVEVTRAVRLAMATHGPPLILSATGGRLGGMGQGEQPVTVPDDGAEREAVVL